MPKGTKVIPYLRTENLKKHTLSRGTYLYSPYMGVPPPGVQCTNHLVAVPPRKEKIRPQDSIPDAVKTRKIELILFHLEDENKIFTLSNQKTVYLIQTNAFGSKILKYTSISFSLAVCTEKPSHFKNAATWHQAVANCLPRKRRQYL